MSSLNDDKSKTLAQPKFMFSTSSPYSFQFQAHMNRKARYDNTTESVHDAKKSNFNG